MSGLRSGGRFPRDLVADIAMHLPVSTVLLPHLSTHGVRQWLERHGIQHRVDTFDRLLHGCLVALAGTAIVFIDTDDDEAEARFTLAHEIAHFILDHLLPRLRVLKLFGDRIRPVLDGERVPTPEEMVSAVLERVDLGLHVHLMGRGPDGAVCAWDVEDREQRADRFALELLAPAQYAIAALRNQFGEFDDFVGQQVLAAEYIAERFGLPVRVAGSYLRYIVGKRRPRAELSQVLFGGKR
jgi:hypothetical protein